MRILIAGVTYHPALNGQAIFTVNLAEGLAGRGHEVMMVFPAGKNRGPGLHNGVQLEPVRSLDMTFLHPDSYVPLPSRPQMRRLLKVFQPDIVHIQDHYPPSSSLFHEARRGGFKIVGTNHFMPDNLAPYIPGASTVKPVYDRLMWGWMLEVYNRLEVVATQSQAAAGLVRAHGLRVPVYAASCGVDLRRFHPDPSVDRTACRLRYGLDTHKTLFLFVGRVDKEKRVDLLLHALRHLGRDDIQLVVAGEGAALNDLQALAKSLRLGGRVHFTGFIPNEDLPSLLNSADIFCMPSAAELLSIASVEAMACGRPVLLADAVALPDLVTPGVNGYLFRPGEALDLAHYMELLADARGRWPAMGEASAEKAAYHSLENTLQRYESLYQQVCAGGQLAGT